MMKYEIKKVFSRSGGSIALLLLLAVFLITCFAATNVSYVNEAGITETGPSAVRKLRRAKEPWSGVLDTELIGKVIAENRRISATPEAASADGTKNDISYGWKQGFSEIRDLLNVSYASGFRDYDYYRADSLEPEQAELFYANRIRLLKAWLEGEAKDQFTDAEKNYVINQYETLSTPFDYEYMEGWVKVLEYAPTILMITILILGYLVAGIFSGEFHWRAEAVFYSAYYGRDQAVRAKVKAGFFISTVVYWVIFLAYSLVILLYLGAGGAGCQIQADWSEWKSVYHLTNLQAYILTAVGGYLGCLFMTSLTMLVSAKTRSTVIAVMVPFGLIFIPSFISGFDSPIVSKIIGLLPDQLLQMGIVLSTFEFYSLFGVITGAVPLLFLLYGILVLILQPVMYSVYRRKQVQ